MYTIMNFHSLTIGWMNLSVRDVNFVFFQKSIFVLKKSDFFSIIEFWFCASLTVGLLMLQSHYVLART